MKLHRLALTALHGKWPIYVLFNTSTATRRMKRFPLLAAFAVLALPSTALAVAPNTYIDNVQDHDSAQLIDEDGSGTETMRTTFHGDGIAASSIRFRCRYDGASYASCTSPWSRSTSVGTHTVWVQAYNNVTGERDQSPASRSFTILPRGGTAPPPPPPPPPPEAGNVIAGAGDIATSGGAQEETAGLIEAINPGVVFTTGDNAYENGSASDFANYYDPTWGRFKAKTRPTPGNHEYLTSAASGYFGYFGVPEYYAYDVNGWRVYALNSEIARGSGSAQLTWLQDDLAANPRQCSLAYLHRPRWTRGNYDDFSDIGPIYTALHNAGVELLLAGHDHNYQRYQPMNPTGQADPNGIREILVGTGGRGLYGLRADARRQAQAVTHGVLKLTLNADSYAWDFNPVSGTYDDRGTGQCHGAGSPPPPPPPPSGGNVTLPVRAAFHYPWYPPTTFGRFHPVLGGYSDSAAAVVDDHIRAMDYGKIRVSINSWWGPNMQSEEIRIPLLLDRTFALGSQLKHSVYYEDEGFGNPTGATIASDLDYLRRYADRPEWAKVNGQPVVFVYADGGDACGMADRWEQFDTNWYLVLKVFGGYLNCANQPDAWHQYGPASAVQVHRDSYVISPGFWHYTEANPRLKREHLALSQPGTAPVADWDANVRAMATSGKPWQLVTTFSEWGEATAVDEASEWQSAGRGYYLDVIRTDGQ